MNEWKESELGNLVDVKGGKRLPKGKMLVEYKTSHPYIRVTDITNNKIDLNGLLYVEPEVQKTIKRYIVNDGDVILSIVGTIGLVATIPKALDNANLTENCVKLKIKNRGLDSKYLYHYLRSKTGQEEIDSLVVGSTQPKFPLYNIKKIKLLLPALSEQERIAEVLSSLDDKIDFLHRQNKTLEEMAETLFRQWLSKLNDRETTTIGEYIRIQNGYAFKSNDFKDSGNNGILKITNISNEQVDIHNTQFVDDNVVSELSEKFLAAPKSFLIAMTGAEIGKIGIIERTNKRLYINQRVGMLVDILENSSLLGYLFLKSAEGQDHIVNTCTGSAQENISSFGIESMLVPKSSPEEVSSFCNSANPLFEKIIYNLEHIQKLSTLRDTLLPKLMSGEVRLQN